MARERQVESPAGQASSRPESPRPFERFLRGLRAFGEVVGLAKRSQTPTPPARGGAGGATMRPMAEYSDEFLGRDNWLTGGLPVQPRQAEGAAPRRTQYRPGQNIQITPRSSEGISFEILRNFSEFSLSRAVIEHQKKAMQAEDWDLSPVDEDSSESHKEDIKAASDFLEYPDREQSWDQWMNALIEDRLAIDAATIYRHRTRGGKLWALELIDGSTIKPLIDERGFTPGRDDPSVPAYQQFLYGVPDANYTRADLIYAVANRRPNRFYGYSETEQAIMFINMGIRRELYNVASFSDSNIPAGLANVPKEWRLEEIQKYQRYFDTVLAGDLQERSKLIWAPADAKIERFHDPFELKNDFDEWMARVICYFFGVSPIPFIKMTNRSVAEEMQDSETEGGIMVLKTWLARLMTEIVQQDLGFPHLKFTWTTDKARMKLKAIQADDVQIKNGSKQIDEVRVERGYKPLNLPPGYPTPTGYATFAEGRNPLGAMLGPDGKPKKPGQPGDEETKPKDEKKPARDREDAGQTQESDVARKALDHARQDELGKWERFAAARVHDLEKAAAFQADFIDEREAEEIRAEISKAVSVEDVKHLFQTRRQAKRPVRLAPPTPSDAGHKVAELQGALRAALVPFAQELASRPPARKESAAVQPIEVKVVQGLPEEFERRVGTVLRDAIEEMSKARKMEDEERRRVEMEAMKILVEGQAQTTREALELAVGKVAAATVEAAKSAPAPVFHVAPAQVTVEAARVTVPELRPTFKIEAPAPPTSPPVEKLAPEIKKKNRRVIISRNKEGEMTGFDIFDLE